MFIPIEIGALGTLTKGLIKGLEDLEVKRWVETIQTTASFRLARILKRDQDSSERPSANTGVKNSQGVK